MRIEHARRYKRRSSTGERALLRFTHFLVFPVDCNVPSSKGLRATRERLELLAAREKGWERVEGRVRWRRWWRRRDQIEQLLEEPREERIEIFASYFGSKRKEGLLERARERKRRERKIRMHARRVRETQRARGQSP